MHLKIIFLFKIIYKFARQFQIYKKKSCYQNLQNYVTHEFTSSVNNPKIDQNKIDI